MTKDESKALQRLKRTLRGKRPIDASDVAALIEDFEVLQDAYARMFRAPCRFCGKSPADEN